MSDKRNKLIAVVGPTASGKTDLSVSLAGELDGEIYPATPCSIPRNEYRYGEADPRRKSAA